jgi:hypothetical protein
MRQPDALAATSQLTGPFSMRWSAGADGRLLCTWHAPPPRKANQSENRVSRRRAGLAERERSTLARDRVPEALAAC